MAATIDELRHSGLAQRRKDTDTRMIASSFRSKYSLRGMKASARKSFIMGGRQFAGPCRAMLGQIAVGGIESYLRSYGVSTPEALGGEHRQDSTSVAKVGAKYSNQLEYSGNSCNGVFFF